MENEYPAPNDASIRDSSVFSHLFDIQVPEFVVGFECKDSANMEKYWPAGTKVARKVDSSCRMS